MKWSKAWMANRRKRIQGRKTWTVRRKLRIYGRKFWIQYESDARDEEFGFKDENCRMRERKDRIFKKP